MVLRSELFVKMGTNLLRSDLMHRAHEGETCKLIDGGFAFLVQVYCVNLLFLSPDPSVFFCLDKTSCRDLVLLSLRVRHSVICFAQALLVMIATSALVFKRYCSLMQCKYYPNPKRSVFVWFLDVSKQVSDNETQCEG